MAHMNCPALGQVRAVAEFIDDFDVGLRIQCGLWRLSKLRKACLKTTKHQ